MVLVHLADNEGHIHAKFKNEGFLPLEIKKEMLFVKVYL